MLTVNINEILSIMKHIETATFLVITRYDVLSPTANISCVFFSYCDIRTVHGTASKSSIE